MPQDPKKKSAVRSSKPLDTSPKLSAEDLLIKKIRKEDDALFRRLSAKSEQIRIKKSGKSSRRKPIKPKHI